MAGTVVEAWPVELVDLDTLTTHPRNFREHDIGAIAASISHFGVWRAMVAQTSTRHVIVGNGELEALRVLGKRQGPVKWLDVDDETALAILLADNWIPGRGRNMDPELLAVMQDLADDRDAFEAAGLDDDDLDVLMRAVEDLDTPLKLDSRKSVRKRPVTCPECGAKFTPGATRNDDA